MDEISFSHVYGLMVKVRRQAQVEKMELGNGRTSYPVATRFSVCDTTRRYPGLADLAEQVRSTLQGCCITLDVFREHRSHRLNWRKL